MAATLYVTESRNDDDLARGLGSLAIRLPVPHGDVCFFGVGDNDTSLRVCVERKKIGDLAQCILNGRYLHQAQQAKEAGFDVLCLVVEGRVRADPDDGLLEVPVWGLNPRTLRRSQFWQPVKPTITYSRWCQYLHELDYLAGICVMRALDVKETVAVVKALWDNFQTPPSKHGSLHQMFSQPPDRVLLVPPGLVRRVAKELPGIGWERSAEVAAKFSTVREMVDAGVEDWESIPGIGKVTAEKAVAALNGGA